MENVPLMSANVFLTLLKKLAIVSVSLIPAMSGHAQTLVLTNQNCPECDASMKPALDALRLNSFGVAARSINGHVIGHVGAFKYNSPGNVKWRPQPQGGTKEILCGKLDKFGVSHLPPEQDWDLRIEPLPSYWRLFDQAEQLTDNKSLTNCPGARCIGAEIDSDQSFWNNQYFNIPSKHSELLGRNICVYGAWVMDLAHGNKPEIHPAEAIWWGDADSVFALILQDDSNRFDREEQFEAIPKPAEWRPWSAPPVQEEVLVAFDLGLPRPSTPHVTVPPYASSIYDAITIEERASRYIVTAAQPGLSADVGPGHSYDITYEGKKLLSVNETPISDEDLGVQFTRYCRVNAGKLGERLVGYVSLRTALGVDDHGQEGYQLLKISRSKLTADQPQSPNFSWDFERFPWPSTSLEIVASSVRRAGRSLVADFKAMADDDAPVPLEIQSAWFGNNKRTDSIALVRSYDGDHKPFTVLSAVPIVEDGDVLLKLPSGERLRGNFPKLTFAPQLARESAWAPRIDESARAVVASTVGIDILRRLPGNFVRSDSQGVDISVAYSQTGDEIAEEESASLADLLNSALNNRPNNKENRKLEALFGTQDPLQRLWRVRAKNLRTKHISTVHLGEIDSAEGIQVDTANNGPSTAVRVRFAAGMKEPRSVNVVFEVKDPFGISGRLSHTIWSHYLVVSDPRSFAENLISLLPRQRSLSRFDWALYRESVRTRARIAARDLRITPSELQEVLQQGHISKPIKPHPR